MKVLVTGATGDVGRHVTARLLADGVAVRALCRSAPDGLPRDGGGGARRPDGAARRSSARWRAWTRSCTARRISAAAGATLHRRVNVGGTRAAARGGAARARRPRGAPEHRRGLRPQGRRADRSPGGRLRPVPRAARRLRLVEDRRRALGRPLSRPTAGSTPSCFAPASSTAGGATSWPGSPGGPSARCSPSSARRGCCCRWCTCATSPRPCVRALRTASAPAEPLDLVGPDMPTQAEYLAPAECGARRARRAGLRARPRACCGGSRPPERVRTARALAYRLAWATQSVRYDDGPLARALGWCPGIELAAGARAAPPCAPSGGAVTSRRGRSGDGAPPSETRHGDSSRRRRPCPGRRDRRPGCRTTGPRSATRRSPR